MIRPDFAIVAKAVLGTEGLGMGLTEKQTQKYVEENWKARADVVREGYRPWAERLNQDIT